MGPATGPSTTVDTATPGPPPGASGATVTVVLPSEDVDVDVDVGGIVVARAGEAPSGPTSPEPSWEASGEVVDVPAVNVDVVAVAGLIVLADVMIVEVLVVVVAQATVVVGPPVLVVALLVVVQATVVGGAKVVVVSWAGRSWAPGNSSIGVRLFTVLA